MLASISHELITPLNCSITMLNIMKDYPEIEDKIKNQFIIPALFSNQLLLNIIHDLLDFNQIESDQLKLTYSKFYLKDVILECLTLISYQAHLKNLAVQFYYSEDLPQIFNNDQNRLRQVMLNLLSNAVKFTNNGYISVNVKVNNCNNSNSNNFDSNDALIEVNDTGLGIKQDIQQLIFNQFGKSNININTHGAGLGLTICSILVRALSGNQQINLKSEEGKGSTFSFVLKNMRDNQRGLSIKRSLLRQSFNLINQSNQELSSPVNQNKTQNENRFTLYSIAEIKERKANSSSICNVIESGTTLNKFEIHELNLFKNQQNNYFNECQNQIQFKNDQQQTNYNQINQQQQQKWSENQFLQQQNQQNQEQFINQQNKKINQFKIKLQPVIVNQEYIQTTNNFNFNKSCKCNQILAVDDNNFNLYTLQNLLQSQFNLKIDVSTSGQEAIDLIKYKLTNSQCCKTYSLILMDLDMPQKDGFETTKEIMQILKNQNIKKSSFISACTANISQQDQKKAKASGMKFFLEKPITKDNMHNLLTKINKQLNNL